ncbi:S8 family serine peptidase [Leptothoe spongobia]|uniref:S8 family serine peptidase n=1 Tax=Leptothoe spongobia TAU-MAC 1115 TaxID=1967444 RepID=A0A947DHV1_9CYAN|nr:S8 family serine peptidase [Leptothoe spongobia]MBT9316908.1 S8 family serine peptidase [Leptothoe spongobia TAU-MAC 1115]
MMEDAKTHHPTNCNPDIEVNVPENSDDIKERFSGFLIIGLDGRIDDCDGDDLRGVARALDLSGLEKVLAEFPDVPNRRQITSVSPKCIRELESKAQNLPISCPSLTKYWRLDLRKQSRDEQQTILKLFTALDEVASAYLEFSANIFVGDPQTSPVPQVSEPLNLAAPAALVPPDLRATQFYLENAARGIGARNWAHLQPGGKGDGVKLSVVDQGWQHTHPELSAKVTSSPISGVNNPNADAQKHGTSALGVIVAADDGLGVVGIAPNSEPVEVASTYNSTDSSITIADAIIAVLNRSAPGDVLLIEVQLANGTLPVEVDESVLCAILLASECGVIVIEPAGNGSRNLDDWPTPQDKMFSGSATLRSLRRGDVAGGFVDSKAIMVAAATFAMPYNRLPSTNYGSRIDCFALGQRVTTTSNAPLSSPLLLYRLDFADTSAASAIIAGAALVVQSLYATSITTSSPARLLPNTMRQYLSDPTPGVNTEAPGAQIGVMPNLCNIARRQCLVPDIRVRREADDCNQLTTR